MFVPWGALLYTGRRVTARGGPLPPVTDAPPPTADAASVARHVGHLALLGALLILALYGRFARALVDPVAVPSLARAPAERPWPPAGTSAAADGYLTGAAGLRTQCAFHGVPPAPAFRQPARTTPLTYVVEPGDTLAALAERFGLEARTIVWANDALAASPTLRVGQELVILPVDGIYHTVAPGETVERVAAKYGVDAARIRAFPGNGLAEGEALEVGQGLVLPGALPGYRAGGGGLPFLPTPELPEGAAGGTGSMVWPLTGMLSQGYWEGHPAIDIAAPAGTPILAVDAGVVGFVQYGHPQYGTLVVLNHGEGLQTLYAHLESACVEVGMPIAQGQVIGACGRTGNSTGTHLHLEVYRNGARQNPLSYLP